MEGGLIATGLLAGVFETDDLRVFVVAPGAAVFDEVEAAVRAQFQIHRAHESHVRAEPLHLRDLVDDGENWEVLTAPSVYEAVLEAVKKAGITPESASVAMIPNLFVKLEGTQATSMIRLMEAMEDQDDVQNVHSNFDIDQKLLEEVAG